MVFCLRCAWMKMVFYRNKTVVKAAICGSDSGLDLLKISTPGA
jgi:ribosomal protein S27E